MRQYSIALAALAVFIGAIVLGNYWIVNGLPFGLSTATPYGTHTVPVGFGLVAPAGVYVVALTFGARDVVQRSGGLLLGFAAILIAAVVSWWISSPAIAVSSGGTFLISESIDAACYTPLRKRFAWGVLVSSAIAATVDSLVFLKWSGIGYGGGQLAGLIVGKLWIVGLVGFPLALLLRKSLPNNDLELLPA